MKTRDPATLTAGKINAELDRLEKKASAINAALIEAGRGWEKPTETVTKGDALSILYVETHAAIAALRAEVRARYGPDAPSRLPTWRGHTIRARVRT